MTATFFVWLHVYDVTQRKCCFYFRTSSHSSNWLKRFIDDNSSPNICLLNCHLNTKHLFNNVNLWSDWISILDIKRLNFRRFVAPRWDDWRTTFIILSKKNSFRHAKIVAHSELRQKWELWKQKLKGPAFSQILKIWTP